MRTRWPVVLLVMFLFVGFVWPTPYLTSKGEAGISIGAFWPMVVYAADRGLPATAFAVGWMVIGLFVGGAIGYRLQRRKEAKP